MIKKSDKVLEAYQELVAKSPDGGINAKDLLDYARPMDSPLHKYFTWDDNLAGETYRLSQARQLLIGITVEIESRKVRSYQSIEIVTNDIRSRRYFDVETVLSSPSLKESAMRQIIRDLQFMLVKYSAYKEIFGMINEGEVKKMDTELKRGGIR